MAQQRTVNSQLQAHQKQEESDTQGFLYSYVFRRAHTDGSLTGEEVKEFENATATQLKESQSSNPSEVVGRRLAEIGDEIDAQYECELKEIVELTGSPESAFKMFTEVARNLFEWDEQGGATINVGRIAALLAYCYHLCKKYIQQNYAAGGLISFLMMVGGWLFKFLLKAKFYEWLEKQGGWGQMLSAVTGGLGGRNVFLFIGIASLCVWAYSYLRR